MEIHKARFSELQATDLYAIALGSNRTHRTEDIQAAQAGGSARPNVGNLNDL
jgi:hypothetical protein